MHTAYIGMGANLESDVGAPDHTLTAAVLRLEKLGKVVARSALYSTEPVGYADQPQFVNAVVALETKLAPHALLDELLELERAFGRDRSKGVQNGPRTLDLDILLMDDLVVSEAGLEIPHSRLAERAFVLVPLNEIAPQMVDPRKKMTAADLLRILLANGEGETNAVEPMQSDVWRGGVGDGPDARDGSARAVPGKPDTDG